MNATLIAKLIEAGTPADLVAEVALELGRAAAAQESLESRRKHERERKAKSREVTGHRVTGRDNVDSPSPLCPPLQSPPDPQNTPPPISPQPEDLSAEPTPKPLTKNEVIEAWQQRMVPQGFPPIRKMTGQRDRQLSARLRDSTLDEWLQAMAALERSAFCRGDNDRGWRADFDFLLQPKSFTKLLEGAYDH